MENANSAFDFASLFRSFSTDLSSRGGRERNQIAACNPPGDHTRSDAGVPTEIAMTAREQLPACSSALSRR